MVPVVFPHSTALWLFSLTAVALLLVPGPAVLYVVVQSAEQGRRVGLASVAGIHLGTLVHVAAATCTRVPRWIPATEARPTRRPCSAPWTTT